MFTRPKTPPDRPEKGEWIVESRDRDEVRSFLTDAAQVVKAMREAPNQPGKWLHGIRELNSRLHTLKPTWCGIVDTRLMALHVERPDWAGPDTTIETFATFLDAPACFPEAAGTLKHLATLYLDLHDLLFRLGCGKQRAGDDADGVEWYCAKIREALGLPTDAGVALTADHEAILSVLGEKPWKCMTVIDVLSAGTIRNRETVGRLLAELAGFRLVNRPHGKRKGYALTDEGREWMRVHRRHNSGANAVITPAHR